MSENKNKLDPPRKARARSPNLQRTDLIGSVTSRDVTKSVNIVLARWFHFFDAKPKNVHFWCPKVGFRYRPLEWLIQLTSIFFRVPPNLSVKLPRDCSDVTHHRCCTGKSDYNPKKRRAHKITSCSFCAVRRKERFAQSHLPKQKCRNLPLFSGSDNVKNGTPNWTKIAFPRFGNCDLAVSENRFCFDNLILRFQNTTWGGGVRNFCRQNLE